MSHAVESGVVDVVFVPSARPSEYFMQAVWETWGRSSHLRPNIHQEPFKLRSAHWMICFRELPVSCAFELSIACNGLNDQNRFLQQHQHIYIYT